jgi:hypothetical protein
MYVTSKQSFCCLKKEFDIKFGFDINEKYLWKSVKLSQIYVGKSVRIAQIYVEKSVNNHFKQLIFNKLRPIKMVKDFPNHFEKGPLSILSQTRPFLSKTNYILFSIWNKFLLLHFLKQKEDPSV